MTTFGRPAISTPNAVDLRALQGAIAAARRRIEILEEAVRALETATGASNSAQLAVLLARINNIVLGNGTVTSVGATAPSFLSVSGTPITTFGTLAFDLATQTRGLVFAGPLSGADAAPNFRSLEWNFDLPLFSTLPFTSGLDGHEIVPIERYGDMYWTTVADIVALASRSTFQWFSVAGDHTLVAANMENGISTSGGTGVQNITIPSGLSGDAVLIYASGAAGVMISPVSGVTLRVRSGLTPVLAGQYAVATLIRRAADEWFLSGDLAT